MKNMATLRVLKVGFVPLKRVSKGVKAERTKGTFFYNSKMTGRAPTKKTIVQAKADRMLKSLKPRIAAVFLKMLEEIRLNPRITIEDLSVKVIKEMSLREPNEIHPVNSVFMLYRAARKESVILSE